MSTDAPGRSGRFSRPLDPAAAALNNSLAFDLRLAEDDVAGSRAHARMLAAVGLLAESELAAIERAFDTTLGEIRAGRLPLDPEVEDVHMLIERRVTALAGEAGARLHTGRSRNDQVATDLRLYAKRTIGARRAELRTLRRALVAQAREGLDTLLPGTTHLQPAQPVRLAHHLLAYDAMLARDDGRLQDAIGRADESPLGCGALAGTSLPIDRAATARSLGFARLASNSLDAVSDRDFCVEIVAACALCLVHLSRLGEELVLWSTPAYGFVKLPESHCSGSSLMPQKRNPDIAELARAKAGRASGDLVALLSVLKGLPLAYNKDLQETQEPFYDALDTLGLVLRALASCMDGVAFDAQRMRAALAPEASGELPATDLAEALVARGVPFRLAHDRVGSAVRAAEEAGCSLARLPAEILAKALELPPTISADLQRGLDPALTIERHGAPGGPARAAVLTELTRVEAALASDPPHAHGGS